MKSKILGEARALYRARKYPDVIRLLEPEVFRNRESFDYFRLLGFSCLNSGDIGGAFSYLSRAHQLKDEDIDVLLGMAAIHFRKGENESALKRWLTVLELQPKNEIARRGMEILRRGLAPDALQEFIEAGRLKTLFPSSGRNLSWGVPVLVALAVLAFAGLGYLGWRVSRPQPMERPGVTGIEIPADLPRVIEAGSDFPFVFTEREVKRTFEKAKSYLLAFRDNLAAVEINRMLLSNATLAVKERARMLKGFVTQASFDTLKDPFEYAAVARQPMLYEGCSVSWRGKIANLKTTKEAITFDLLVGYDQETELQGIVPVILRFAVELENGVALEVLGQVVAEQGKLALSGISVHRLFNP
jgi:hypothetical protein